MEQVHFRGKVRIIRKSAERVDGRVDNNTGEQAAAAIKDRDQQETDCDGKNNLAQVIDKLHAAAVEQVDDMPNAESYTGNNNGGLDIVLCNGLKQQPPEDHFLQKSDAEHTHDAADRCRRRVIESEAVPEISRCQNHKRHIVKEPTCRNGRFTKPIPFLQVVLSDKGEKHDRLQNAESGACRVCDPDGLVQRIRQRLQNAVNHDPYNRKGQLVFLI